MGVVDFLCDRRFHQSFVLQPDPQIGRHKPYRFSYADFGDRDGNAVVLFCGALMGTRFCYAPLDQLATAYNVRIIHPDRPGIGGSDPVELEKRIQLWLEMVPQLLKHINVSCISLASHSGGNLYLLNTMLMYPHLLHPFNPYVCFFAPWVHPSHSKVTQMRATDLLPAPMIGRFASIVKFVNDNVMPLISNNAKSLRALQNIPSPVPLSSSTTLSRSASGPRKSSDLLLDDPHVVDELRDLIVTFMFAENIEGISADAQLFMKKPRTLSWCPTSMHWSDVDYFVPFFSKLVDGDVRLGHNRTWAIDTFHAEHDDMVGRKGVQWFDNCWIPGRKSDCSIESLCTGDSHGCVIRPYKYRSETVEGSEHNYLMDPCLGASALWLMRVRDSFMVELDESGIESESMLSKSLRKKGRRQTVRGHIDKAWCSMAKGLHR